MFAIAIFFSNTFCGRCFLFCLFILSLCVVFVLSIKNVRTSLVTFIYSTTKETHQSLLGAFMENRMKK